MFTMIQSFADDKLINIKRQRCTGGKNYKQSFFRPQKA